MSAPLASTVVDCLRRTAERAPDNGITVYGRHGDTASLGYPELLARARGFALGLLGLGLRPRQRVGLFLPSSIEFFVAYFGALMARVVPVSLPVPAFGRRLNQREAQRLRSIVDDAGLACVVDGAGLGADEILSPSIARSAFAAIFAPVPEEQAGVELAPERPDDPALIQYTSGSTASPRGVVLSEQNISANIQLIGRHVDMNPRDTIDLWIPLFHDMGLMGSLTTIASGANLRICSPSVFLVDPLGWLLRFAARRSTINPSPNFFFRLLVDEYDAARVSGLDLRSWRVAFNGAEMVLPGDVQRFQHVYGPHGFPATTMYPVYGLAESTLALAFPAHGPPSTVRGDEVFGDDAPSHFRERVFVSVGRPLPGHEITLRRVGDVEAGSAELPPEVGEILARGPSIMQGYTRASSPELLRPFVDGWLPTRDLGFWHEGDLFVCGRMDEVIIVRGSNYFPQDIETLVERSSAMDGVEVVAKAAFRLEGISPDGVGLAVEIKRASTEIEEQIRRLEGELVRELGFQVKVIGLAPRTIPRTTSGKLKRLALAAMLARGELSRVAVGRIEGVDPPGP